MKDFFRIVSLVALLCVGLSGTLSHAVELRVSRDALQRTLHQQLFNTPGARYYLKGDAKSPCFVYADDAQIHFLQDRVAVVIQTHAKVGKTMGNSCWGISLNSSPEVSLSPFGQGELIGFQDAKLDKIVDNREINFLVSPFLSHQLPHSMMINAGDLLRKALANSTASCGYKVSLSQFVIRSMRVEGDDIVVEADGGLAVK